MAHILMGVSGSAACFKAAALCSQLTREQHQVQVVLTPAAAQMVTPLQFSCLSGKAALCDEFDPQHPSGMDHIAFADEADVLVVVPATANTLGILAQGLALHLLGSLALAFDPSKPRLFAPAMHPRMWANPAVQRNVGVLVSDGWQMIGPEEGSTACGSVGLGRMAEVAAIFQAIANIQIS